jgi:stearoyl-CoA desaturase (delta-9 desaturase)
MYSHVGWIFARQHDATDLVKVSDFVSYPELIWLHKSEVLPAIVIAALCVLIAGWSRLVVGFLWSTVLKRPESGSHTFLAGIADRAASGAAQRR